MVSSGQGTRRTSMKVAAIIPAYNEEQTIGEVAEALMNFESIDEVIVVNDGSEDQTAQVARRHPVTVIDLQENLGKGGAMVEGSAHTDADILLFIDADLVGLTQQHINQLLQPVVQGDADMTVGVFEEGRLATDLAQKIAPFLSGQRAIHRRLWDVIPELEDSRYGVEMTLSRYAEKNNSPVEVVYLQDLSQVMKEEKHGFWRGVVQRLKMYWEIIRRVKL